MNQPKEICRLTKKKQRANKILLTNKKHTIKRNYEKSADFYFLFVNFLFFNFNLTFIVMTLLPIYKSMCLPPPFPPSQPLNMENETTNLNLYLI